MKTTCPIDGQHWGVALQSLTARPGYRTEPALELTRLEDINGRSLGTGYRKSSRWISQGQPVQIVRGEDDGLQLTWTYSWPCGDHRCEVEVPATDLVRCGACTKAADAANPPSGYYTNPRYGMACPCCGQQGTHLVVRSEPGPDCIPESAGPE